MRRETLWELLKQKNLPLPGDGSFRAFEKAVSVQKPKDLGHFLSAFPIFLPAIKWVTYFKWNFEVINILISFLFLRGDLQAIKRISVEFSEDLARNGVLYAEPRFCPHLMLSEDAPEVKAKHVVQTVLEGLREGEQLFGVKVICYYYLNSNIFVLVKFYKRSMIYDQYLFMFYCYLIAKST